jgi:iron complex outermembrane receptor protein
MTFTCIKFISFINCMKYLLPLFLFSYTGFAQSFIKGTVKDSTGSALSFASVGLMNAKDSSLVKGNVSDEKGNYEFTSIRTGTYILKFYYAGYKVKWSDVFSADSLSQVIAPEITLRTEGINLKEVSVMAFKPIMEFKKGKVIMNIENNILAAGNTVYELLKRIPGVSIDAQGNILVNGQSGVRFLIDGRLSQIPTSQLLNTFNSMPADAVSVIELIANPPARYDAAGTGGLINIVMKKAKLNGFSGNVFQTQSKGSYWRQGNYTTINYRSNKFTLYTFLNYSYWDFATWNKFDRKITDTSGDFHLVSTGYQDTYKHTINANVGMDYEISKKTTVGIVFNGGKSLTTNNEYARGNMESGTFRGYNYFNFTNKSPQDQFNPSINLNLTHKIDSVTTLQLSTDYTNYTEHRKRYNVTNYFDNSDAQVAPTNQFGTTIYNNFNIYTQKADLTRDFKHKVSLETGFKSAFADNKSNSTVELTDSAGNLYVSSVYSNSYRYHERILAGYLTLNKEFKKISLSAGVRTEHTLANAGNDPKPFTLHRDYINFFPSGSMDLRLNKKNTLSGSYSYRIGRPSYDQLNPTRIFNDAFSNGAGNPSLKPEFGHMVNLNYNFNNFINSNISYLIKKDNIYFYAYGDPNTKATIDSVFNYKNQTFTTFNTFIQKQIKWFSFQAYAGYVYRTNSTMVGGTYVNKISSLWNFNITTEYMLPKDIKFQIQGYYNSINIDGIQTYYPNGVLNLTVFKSFFKKKLDVSISLFDALYSDIHPWTNSVGNQYSYYTERNDTRRVRVFFRWNFGKMRINQKQKRSNDDEKNRLKNIN